MQGGPFRGSSRGEGRVVQAGWCMVNSAATAAAHTTSLTGSLSLSVGCRKLSSAVVGHRHRHLHSNMVATVFEARTSKGHGGAKNWSLTSSQCPNLKDFLQLTVRNPSKSLYIMLRSLSHQSCGCGYHQLEEAPLEWHVIAPNKVHSSSGGTREY
ncbi:hypothetical protein EDD17DRAFT_1851612 [Pisolithus thermaeus]|nr:hypothetical protein EV401DRAFT_1893108 [Pisolithus croceorrhizus]KAI6152786.1 hypothetical protein EDD17DRAFT_1851612 [Pisolithus thermaeus]